MAELNLQLNSDAYQNFGFNIYLTKDTLDLNEEIDLSNFQQVIPSVEVAATRNQVFEQDAPPEGGYQLGDLWIDTDDENHMYRANTLLQWVSARDGTIADAAGSANWSEVVNDDTNKPDDNATIGAKTGTNLTDSGDTTLDDEDIIKYLESFYGDGDDGNVTISGNTTLTSDMYYNNLTINTTSVLNTGGYRIFVKGTLTIESGSSISRVGNVGGNGQDGLLNGSQEGRGGAAGAALVAGFYPATEAGKAGQDGGQGSANSNAKNNDEAGGSEDGLGGGSVSNSVGVNGVASGVGGAGGDSPSYTGGTGAGAGGAGTATATTSMPRNYTNANLWIDFSNIASLVQYTGSAGSGSAGGGGGASGEFDGSAQYGGGGGAGGGSGSTGGIIGIFAKEVVNAGTITVQGGGGGAGGDGNNGTTGKNTGGGGGAGGSGGGPGGIIILAYNKYSGAGSLTYTGGAAGSAGAAGSGFGTGDAGVAGAAGNAGTTGVLLELKN